MTFALISCSGYKNTDYYIGDYKVYYEDKGTCEILILQPFYTDEEYIYAFGFGGCDAGSYYFIKINDEYIDVETAIEEQLITIDQVIASQIDVYTKAVDDEIGQFEKI